MPNYNTSEYISDSIHSVINQTYTNWELIIVDDCSSDNSVELIRSFDDSRIRIYINEVNSGAAYSRNYALRKAKGRWIAFLDSDDLWHPDKLSKQVSFMIENGYHFSYTNYEIIDCLGNAQGVTVTGPKIITQHGMYNYCWPGCLTVIYDANVAGLVQIENIKKNNDYAMWLKVIRFANCYLLDETLAFYRKGRSGSISTQSLKTLILWHFKLFYEAEKFSAFKSVLFTIRNIVFGTYKKIRYVRTTLK